MANFFKRLFAPATPHMATILPQGTSFSVGPAQTLLEAALAHNIDFPHNCTVGTCGSCRCKLTEGRVSAITDFGYTLSREELEAGYILACQATLKTPVTVEVEIAPADLPAPESFTGRIVAQARLTHDILAITVRLDRPMRYIAGQYATLTLPDVAGRSYSFATAPQRAGRDEVVFYIRHIPGGAFSGQLFSGALNTAALAVDGPHGAFHLRDGNGLMVCIAGGSGLAPLLSLLHDARKSRLRRPCIMLFGARTQQDLYALDQIEEIRASWQGEFTFHPVLSHEPEDSDWTGRRGFVTTLLPELVSSETAASAQGYLCGPPPMIDAALTSLHQLGLDLSSIYYDKFTDARHQST